SRSCHLLVIRTPRVSALFPYTTLFRSVVPVRLESGAAEIQASAVRHCPTGLCRSEGETARETVDVDELHFSITSSFDGWCSCPVDRKSTRLNSSHVKISYAVFCLKKKT